MMRQFVFIMLLSAGAGCQGLRDSRHSGDGCEKPEPCKPADKKPCAPPARVQAPPPKEEVVEQARAAALAQEVLLVPRTVYMPFVAQTPTAPVRLTSNMTVVQPPAPSVAPPPAKVTTQPETAPCPPEDCTQQMLDLCKKLNQRLDHLERCIQDRQSIAPTVICPPAAPCPQQPLFPQLFRRPLFNRCEPSLPPCETVHEIEPTAAPIRMTPAPESESIAAPTRMLNANPRTNVETNSPSSIPLPLSAPADPSTPVLPIE